MTNEMSTAAEPQLDVAREDVPMLIRCNEAKPMLTHTVPSEILAGEPVKRWADLYVDPTFQFAVGIWHSDIGSWRKVFPEDEFIFVIEGRITLTEDGGKPESFGPGESVIVRRGWTGIWETVEPVKKWYASFEQKR